MNIFKLIARRRRRLLPQGQSDFDAFVDGFIDAFPMPTEDKDSIYFFIATVIVNLGAKQTHKSYAFFYHLLQASVANQVASASFQAVKEKQRLKKEEAKAALEAEAAKTTTSDELQTNQTL